MTYVNCGDLLSGIVYSYEDLQKLIQGLSSISEEDFKKISRVGFDIRINEEENNVKE